MKETIKLKDIADSLNVSVVTVSNALTGKKGVSDSLRKMITEKADELGYTFHKKDNSKNSVEKIGVLVYSKYIQEGSSFYWSMYQQLVYTLSKKGHVGVLEIIEGNVDKIKTPNMVKDNDISGIIIIGMVEDELISKIATKSDKPVVLLDFYKNKYNCDAIMSNNYLGMYEMTKNLYENGHRDIAFVGSIFKSENIMDRYFGYRRCLEENKLEVLDEWLIEGMDSKDELNVELPKNMPTAFVCSNDLIASLLYDELIKNGYEVPKDISIVGYDNYLFGHNFYNNITTYDVNIKLMTKIAVSTVLKRIRNNSQNPTVRYVDGDILERSSVRSI